MGEKLGFLFLFILVVVLVNTPMQAGPVDIITYFGENLTPGGTVTGDPVTARNNFLAGLSGVGNEDFEGFALGTTQPLNLTFPGSSGSITATLSGSYGQIISGGAGRYPTSGTKLWNVDPPGTTGNSFTIDFSDPISAFGFYATDIGDFGGQITLSLTNGSTVNLTVPNTISGPDGSLLFFGFIDPVDSYTRVVFGNTSGADGFGFDDMVIGDRGQVTVSEPSAIILLSLGLAGLGFRRRRSR